MNQELKKMNRIRSVLMISTLLTYLILGLITVYAIENNIFSLEIFLMRLTAALLVMVIYILSVNVIKLHEGCIRKIES